MDNSSITSIINRLPDLPSSQAKPEPASKPTKPPAPTEGIRSMHCQTGMLDNWTAHQQEEQCQSGYAVIVGLVVSCFYGAEVFVEETQEATIHHQNDKPEQIISDIGKICAEEAAEVGDIVAFGHAARPCRVVHAEAGQGNGQINGDNQAKQP